MSDAPETRRGATAPLPVTAQPPAARPATQLSASAVPSTLESPQEPNREGASLGHEITAKDETGREAAERDAANAGSPAQPGTQGSMRRGAPATLMSPAVPIPTDKPASASLAPEDAVIDVGAPAHAFMPHGSVAPHYGSGGGPGGIMHRGPHPGAGPARRATSTTFLVMVVVGGVAGVILLAGLVVGFYYLAERRKAEAAERALHAAAASAATTAPEVPRGPPHFGGTKARLSVTSSGAIDPEAVRASLGAALPRVDACFAAAELEPPNHETAAYDLDVQASGEVKRVEPASAQNRAPRLDACVLQSLHAVRLPKAARASTVKLTFSAPLEVH